MKKRVLLVLALVAAQCALPTELMLPLPAGAERFNEPARWRVYRDSMASCSGLEFRGEIEWWAVPDGSLGEQVAARWDFPHRIALARFYYQNEVGSTIMHELLHDLLGRDNWPPGAAHPPVFDRCHVNP